MAFASYITVLLSAMIGLVFGVGGGYLLVHCYAALCAYYAKLRSDSESAENPPESMVAEKNFWIRLGRLTCPSKPSLVKTFKESGIPALFGPIALGGLGTFLPLLLSKIPEASGIVYHALATYYGCYMLAVFACAWKSYSWRRRHFVRGMLGRFSGLKAAQRIELTDMLQDSYIDSGTFVSSRFQRDIEAKLAEDSCVAEIQEQITDLHQTIARLRGGRNQYARSVSNLCETLGLLRKVATRVTLDLHGVGTPNKHAFRQTVAMVTKRIVEVLGGEDATRAVLYVVLPGEDVAYPLASVQGTPEDPHFAREPISMRDTVIAALLYERRAIVGMEADLPGRVLQTWPNVALVPVPFLRQPGFDKVVYPAAILRVDSQENILPLFQMKTVNKGQSTGVTAYQVQLLAGMIDVVLGSSGLDRRERFDTAIDLLYEPDDSTAGGMPVR